MASFVGVNHFTLSCASFDYSYGFVSPFTPKIPAISLTKIHPPNFSPFQFHKIQHVSKPTFIFLANAVKTTQGSVIVKEKSVSVVLLAGGTGKRMGANMPKQYLPLLGQPIALYSLYTFSQMIEVKEIVVVCDPSYRDIFEETRDKIQVDLRFAEPGKERQDSVYNGLQAIDSTAELVCVHDSARPMVLSQDIKKVLKDGLIHGAAVLGVPVKATIKEANAENFVVKTLDRKTLWEMQTPQVLNPALLKEGFDLVNRKGLEVTDDVSIVEHLGHPVCITEGSYTNIKITTPDDLLVAERILNPSSSP